MIYLQLFWEFCKIGLFSVGGGAATIPFLQDLSAKTGWFTEQQLANIIAVAESTPGAIGVNMSTYVGFTTAGFLGGIIATLGLITPSIIIILIICKFLEKFRDNKIVNFAFYGLRAASAALIMAACYSIFKIAMLNQDKIDEKANFFEFFNYKAIIYGVILAFFIFKFKKHPILYIAISAVIGIIFKFSII